MYYTYILKSDKDKNHYIGSTKNLHVRFLQHNLGKVKSTKARIPFKLIHSEEFMTLGEARSREVEIKKMKGGIQFKRLIESNEMRG